MTSKQFIQEKTMLGDHLMRYSIGGDAAFHILAFHYAAFYSEKVSKIPTAIVRKWELDHNRIEHDSMLLRLLDGIVTNGASGQMTNSASERLCSVSRSRQLISAARYHKRASRWLLTR
jgi:hypothetical protein